MPKKGNHHGSPREIMGEMMREDIPILNAKKLVDASGEEIRAKQDEKTHIESYQPIKTMVLLKTRHESHIKLAATTGEDGVRRINTGCPYFDVVAVGPLCIQVRPGDRVLVPGGAPKYDVPYKGDDSGDHFQIQEGNILGIVNPRVGGVSVDVVMGIVDDHTDDVCVARIGKVACENETPHKTNDPDLKCRCYIVKRVVQGEVCDQTPKASPVGVGTSSQFESGEPPIVFHKGSEEKEVGTAPKAD